MNFIPSKMHENIMQKLMEFSGKMPPKRIYQVQASGLTSVYRNKKKGGRWDIKVFKDGANIAPDMFDALKHLDRAVRRKNGNLYIVSLFRSWEVQAEARKKFEEGEKKDFVAKPGGSFHNAGRAVDISVKHLDFEGVDKEDWLQIFWDIAKPLGFRPIIRIPDINASEAWHFDFPGEDWNDAYRKLPYGKVAKCTILDIGCWQGGDKEKIAKMFIQSQLIRLGYYKIGNIDGVLGPKTKAALKLEGCMGMNFVSICNLISKKHRYKIDEV